MIGKLSPSLASAYNEQYTNGLIAWREVMLRLDPLRQFFRRIRRGQAWYQEFGFSAYTCLAQGVGELKTFDEA